MTQIDPSLQDFSPPDLRRLLAAFGLETRKAVNCVRVGVIKAFDAAQQTATVQIAQQQVTSVKPDGTQTEAQFPLLLEVPVAFPGGGGYTLTFPVHAGDECLILFNDRELDNWFIDGPGFAPSTPRVHDLSDGIAIVGLRSLPRKLAGVSTTAVQLRSDDSSTFVEVGPGKIQLVADEVVIHGRNKTTFDAGGTGFVYTPGTIDTYTDGITPGHHAPHPPEVPT